ncbi:cache domain-containing protein [Roseixanthobacter glucoisosaccharinicivorans]|uniref:cache domain-containing protein n=1 Tax=Roseixanthobacter glucoisosaccharinicivorans TaxID=3119923 RepID=UPI00372A1A77
MKISVLRVLRRFGAWAASLSGPVRISAVIGVPLILVALVAWFDREAELKAARQKVIASAHMLSEHAGARFLSVDVALSRVRDALGIRPAGVLRTDTQMHQLLVRLVRRMPELELAFVIDETGRLVSSSRAYPAPARDLSQREFFLAGKGGQEGLLFSVPFRGAASRSVSFAVSRAVWRDGVFGGVVGAIVFPEYFHSSYRGLLGPNPGAVAALVRKDGTLLLRSPDLRAQQDLPVLIADVPEQRGQHESGLLAASALIEGGPAVAAYRAVPGTDLTVVYALSEGDVLSAWNRRVAGYVLVGGLASFALAVLTRRPTGLRVFGARRQLRLGGVPRPSLSEASVGAVDRVLTPVLADLTFVGTRNRADGPEPEFDEALAGAGHGVRLAQRLLDAGRRGGRPRIVHAPTVLNNVRCLLIGSVWPPLELTVASDAKDMDVFVEPAGFELAVLDLVMDLKQQADAGSQITLGARRDVVRAEPVHVEAGEYVCVTVRAASTMPADGGTLRTARHDEIAAFAARAGGGWQMMTGADGPEARLWIPAALGRREESPAPRFNGLARS